MNDMREGLGRYIWANGSSYEGNWFNDNMNGKGIYVDENKILYEGIW